MLPRYCILYYNSTPLYSDDFMFFAELAYFVFQKHGLVFLSEVLMYCTYFKRLYVDAKP